MSDDDKGFLSRWSQRKQEAKQPERDAPAAEADAAAGPVAENAAEPEFDLSSLPKLEDLTGTSDITVFLRRGVPEHLRNAALSKSWALDPAIRNYVNPALDYAYDWNTPGGVPGSSEIGAGVDIARMVSQIMGGGESVTEPAGSATDRGDAPDSDPMCSAYNSAPQKTEPDLPAPAVRLSSEAQKPSNNEEATPKKARPEQDSDESGAAAPQQTVRRHGSAKPVV
ncbi:DUF3306 domain-containing protein [Bradyrhizobium sp.]|jgi:hypothetical protein|uniref:DUF3306 domain-containing protein n=1 Tax=Bradyrhizobium sp. TaxID=376 RepID=UPI002E07882D|nr:DUF3306 domain-containing protein [Bradyrhizobium sp.]